MGKATASALAKLGAEVVLVARNQSKGEVVRDEIINESGNPNISVLNADLSSQRSIRALADTFQRNYQHLQVPVNNAGGIFFRREITVDGLEMSFAVNHLAPFLLVNLLLDVMKGSAPARIINISSNVERIGKINFDDLQAQKGYNGLGAYAQAKLGSMLFIYELARHLEGTGVTANAVRPGPVATNFARNGHHPLNFLLPVLFRFATPEEEAAQTAIALASDTRFEGVNGKAYYKGKELHSSRKSYDVEIQKCLWQVSEELTGISKITTQQVHESKLRNQGEVWSKFL